MCAAKSLSVFCNHSRRDVEIDPSLILSSDLSKMEEDLAERDALSSSVKALSRSVPELKQLESVLICPICYELMTDPTTTPCLHVFCSLCLRKYLQFKQECPTCHSELHEKSLRQDKTAEKVLGIFPSLVKRIAGVDLRVTNEKENQSPIKNILKTSSQSNSPEVSTGSRLERSNCPVCNVDIPTSNLSHHVERCLRSKDSVPTEPKKPRANPLPKLVYSLFKDKDLRTKCKDYGLNSKGDKSVLVSRLKKYTLLYNNNVASENPKSPLELRMQVEKEEREEKCARVARPEVLHYDRNTNKEEIELKQKTYLKENKDSFTSLKQKVRINNEKKNDLQSTSVAGKPRNFNIIESVENLEDILNRDDEEAIPAGSKMRVEHFSIDETSAGSKMSEETSVNRLKRKSSPLNIKGKSPPSKKVRSKSSKTKSKPQTGKTSKPSVGNIFEKVTLSAEKNRKIPKLPCPVCGLLVPEKFLNIHLDKCLESGTEADRSVTQKEIVQKKKAKNKTARKEEFSTDESDEFEPAEDDKPKSFFLSKGFLQKRETLTRTVVKPPILEASQDSDNAEELEEKKDGVNLDEEEKREEEEIEDNQKNHDDTASLPSSPLYTHSSHQNDLYRLKSRTTSNDMFASSDDEEEEKHDVSSNLLDIDDFIDDRLEAAMESKDNEVRERGSDKATGSEHGTKRVSVSVIPRTREEKSSQEQELKPVRRSSRRKN